MFGFYRVKLSIVTVLLFGCVQDNEFNDYTAGYVLITQKRFEMADRVVKKCV